MDRLKERTRGQDFLEKRRRQAQSLAGQIEKYQRLSESLYPDWKAGDLTREEYHSLKSAYGEKKKALQQELDALMEEPEEDDAFLREFSQKAGVTVLTRELLCALVDKIEVYEGNRIKVCFRFSAGFQELSENLSL